MRWYCALTALGAALFLSGCVSGQGLFTPTAQQGHVIDCSPGWTGGFAGLGTNASAWGQCYQQAGEICGARGYTIVQRTAETAASAQAGQGGGSAPTSINRTLVVQCGGEKSAPSTQRPPSGTSARS